ncbi:hypothetical protein SEUBUCD646_0F00480 [Saccharomyces eubayanus]|uniref:Uncharacterized protein n=2 Tax=Saccharomyces TaxID=4930 RepID=A0A6C1E739_SACPS|nr:hypothetical protein DI49_1642 [Saccharomyces eubayanus]KOG99807.1 hypothetical protein DI49_1642 [Saccharomyces eubayanus]QID84771.1 hypothetical protein GRS66_007296 [Saccharomyces pastorianus]CAI1969663.1 hypothetical protein SEUBUCD650_0F00480 [Saccharomyces eubayanus]CAI1998724.1 hypothetical protein SEUBUCD646_0F00480 [Saccharomyces eubayanus]
MSKRRLKRTIAPCSSDIYDSLQFQNNGYVKIKELISHVVIENSFMSNAIADEAGIRRAAEPTVKEQVHKFRKWKNKTRCVSKDPTMKDFRARKRDMVYRWFERHLPKEKVEVLSHEKQLSSIDLHFLPSNVIVGCSRELSKPGSPQVLGSPNFGPKEEFNERFFNIASCPVKREFRELVFELNDENQNYYTSLRASRKPVIQGQKNAHASQFIVGKEHRTNF